MCERGLERKPAPALALISVPISRLPPVGTLSRLPNLCLPDRLVFLIADADRDAAGDRAAGHGNAHDLLVASVAQIVEAQIRAEAAQLAAGWRAREREIPDRIGRLLITLGNLYGVAQDDLLAECGSPLGARVLDRVVEDVLRLKTVQCALRAVQYGPGEADGLITRWSPRDRKSTRLNSSHI